jgi:hypothetical protein
MADGGRWFPFKLKVESRKAGKIHRSGSRQTFATENRRNAHAFIYGGAMDRSFEVCFSGLTRAKIGMRTVTYRAWPNADPTSTSWSAGVHQ